MAMQPDQDIEFQQRRAQMIARVCHEVNRAYCQALGDNSQPTWEDAPQWQRDSALLGVKLHAENPGASPSASHESWMAQKVTEGWVYGPEKNPELKQHHCIVPFDQLPREQQAKDFIFRGVVHALAAPQPAQPAQPLIDAVAELLGHISDVFDDVEFEKIETKLWNDVSVFVGLYRSHTAPAPLNVVASLGFKLALDADLRRRADKLASALKGSRVNYDVEQDAAKLIWEMRDALAAPQRQPLTQPEKQRLWNDAMHGNRSSTTDAAMDFGSAIETAHGITKDPAA